MEEYCGGCRHVDVDVAKIPCADGCFGTTDHKHWQPKEEQKGCETCRRFPRMGPPPGQSGLWYCGKEKGATSRPPCGAGTECEWWLSKKEQKVRKWLVRDDTEEADYWVFTGERPHRNRGLDGWYNTGVKEAGVCKVESDWSDSAYGQTLEPGGGPVDVTDWKEPDDHATHVAMNIEWFKDFYRKQERKEDTMPVSYYDVAGIRRPTVVAEQNGKVVEEVFHEKDILAGSRDAALVIAGVRNAEKIGDDTSRLEIKVFNERPF